MPTRVLRCSVARLIESHSRSKSATGKVQIASNPSTTFRPLSVRLPVLPVATIALSKGATEARSGKINLSIARD